jgi:hypothetical protein
MRTGYGGDPVSVGSMPSRTIPRRNHCLGCTHTNPSVPELLKPVAFFPPSAVQEAQKNTGPTGCERGLNAFANNSSPESLLGVREIGPIAVPIAANPVGLARSHSVELNFSCMI